MEKILSNKMKGFLVFLAIFAIALARPEPAKELPKGPEKMIKLITGLLVGLNERKDINGLMACIREAEDVFDKIKRALEYLQHKDFDNVKKGLTLLVEAVRQILDMLKPCMTGYEQLIRLYNAVQHPDIVKIVLRILTHPLNFFVDAVKGLICFIGGDWYCVGWCVGDMMRICFLTADEEPAQGPEKMIQLITGLLIGLNERKDINGLMACIHEAEDVFEKIKRALEYLQHKDFDNVKKGLTLLVEAARQILDILKPCMNGYDQLMRLYNAIQHPDIVKIVLRILTHPLDFFVDAIKGLICFIGSDWKCVGWCVGDMLRICFLTADEEPTQGPEKMIQLITGLLIGLNERKDINGLMACIHEAEDVFEKIKKALEYLQHKDFDNVKKGLTLLVEAARQILNMLKPCMNGYDQLMRLYNAIQHPDIVKIVLRILTHPLNFFVDAVKGLICFIGSDWKCVGWCVGDMLRICFLTAIEVANSAKLP